ncbi:MAG: TetR/AcrR family transcriptional regulator [Proteobacteria bacterium]|nr:TetR/AcrR family transcriptional regulator [Pseudomonadota bacterium]
MRYGADHKQATRSRILDAAMILLARGGAGAVTVHGVMRAADLSHGGFYAHFESREALLEAALTAAAERTLSALFGAPADVAQLALRDVIGRYLGRAHLEADTGCPLPATCGGALDESSDAARRRTVQRYRDALAAVAPDQPTADALLALMVGGLAVARALGGDDGEAVLRACRMTARQLATPAS